MNPTLTGLSVGITVAAYALGLRLQRHYPSPLVAPVVTATAAIMAFLLVDELDYASYRECSAGIVSLLGPATSAMAVPLYRHRRLIANYALPALLAMCCGGLATFLAAIVMATACGLAPLVIHSIGIKSVTTPIAVELAAAIGGDASLTAAFVVATGLIGALLGPWLMNRCAIDDPVARGLAFGTISQGFGTVQAMMEGELQGSVSAVAMATTAFVVSLWAPALTRIIG